MKHRAPTLIRAWVALSLAAALAACSVAPRYEPPAPPAAAAFKEALAADEVGQWKTAEPSDALPRGQWWRVFKDPQLDRLQDEAAMANPSLQAGLARLERARAISRSSQSERLPRIDAVAGPTRFRVSPAAAGLARDADSPATTLWRAQAAVSYEVDLFGRVASAAQAAGADAEQAQALQRSLLLAVQADVAQHHFALRALDSELSLLEETIRLRETALQLLQRRFEAGETSELDAARARTELALTRAEAAALQRRRAETEHALALLLGKAPAELAVARAPLAFEPIAIPPGLPSALLERRPDIAAAERAMAAANARIGVARAAAFPRLSLTGALGLESADLGDLFRWSSRTWALGPLVGGMLSMPLFDGGRNRALAEGARAHYDEAVADYRGKVLVAFREVEDSLSGLRMLAQQANEQQQATLAARRSVQLSAARYRNGFVNHLELIDAERSLLAAQRAATQVERERALATVGLIRALGGGWGDAQPRAVPTAALNAGAQPW